MSCWVSQELASAVGVGESVLLRGGLAEVAVELAGDNRLALREVIVAVKRKRLVNSTFAEG